MNHKVGYNRLGRKASHRKSMTRNMVTSLFKHERITTTKAKAREIRRTAEKMVTRAKIDSVHNRRIIAKNLKDKEILNKLFTDISVRFKERPGGYTRILKLGRRKNDAAEMVILELVERNEEIKTKKASKKKKAEEVKEEKEETPVSESEIEETNEPEEESEEAEKNEE